MERLTGLDASFLYLETPTLHMHVSMAAIFDPSTVPGGYSFEKVRALVAERIPFLPVFSRRLAQVPFRLGHPFWVDDPDFDIDNHIRRAAIPSPGGLEELATFVGDVCGRQLDRSRPLWEMYVVEGLEDGKIGLVTKIHHSTIDGVSGAELLGVLFDLEPNPGPREIPTPEPHHGRMPGELELVTQALIGRLVRPIEITRLAWRTGKAVLDVRRIRQLPRTGQAALPLSAPRTSMNAAVTAHRRVAFSSIALDDVKRLKNAAGTTVNDAVLAICTGALRAYLLAGNELPAEPLVATVPVSVHDTQTETRGSNKVSAMFVQLPTELADPRERLQTIREGTKGAKEEHHALGADLLLNWTEHATPNVFAAGARAYSRLKLADRHRPIHNLVISNVPGPDFPLYLAGAELVAGFPLGPVMEGTGLNVTVMSYRGVVNWGLMACADSVRGVWDIADAIPAALDELLAAYELSPAHPVGVAPPGRRRKTGPEAAVRAPTRRRSTKAVTSKATEPKTTPPKATARKAPARRATRGTQPA
jgi:WS/DGAT/MGAT family acyltransferase